ncbi:MAG: pyridoxamine 5'-phosphate oxidase family protein [Chloroflexi bacterium]|nr:pyridoxamine 5'-phosphate oxidase family protein [Chloroflexota bacterium]
MSELRDRIVSHLLKHRVCVLSTSGSAGAWAMPVWYRPVPATVGGRMLDVECLLPRWADVVYHLEVDPQVVLIICDLRATGLWWLQYRGTARIVDSPDWSRLLPDGVSNVRPEERYVAVHLTPQRLDVIDESQGWGARETLDL